MLTVIDQEHMVEAAVDAGADECVTNPFAADVLVAHLRAVLRRQRWAAGPLALVAVSVLVVAGLGWLLEARVTDLVLDQLATQAADWVDLGLRDQLVPADFETPTRPGTLDDVGARLDAAVGRLRQANASLLRFNLFARDGTVIYSDLASLRGRSLLEEEPLLTSALNGASRRQESALSDADDADLGPRHRTALEVYGPLVLGDRVAGAYEVYRDLAPLHALRLVIGGALATWAAAMMLFLLLVARSAASRRVEPTAVSWTPGRLSQGWGQWRQK